MNSTYRVIVEVTDFGPYASKVILPLPEKVKEGQLGPESFSVYVERRDLITGQIAMVQTSWESKEKFPSVGYVEVENAYVVDEKGDKVDEGAYVLLQLPTRPFYPLSSELAMNGLFNEFVFNDYTICQIKEIQGEEGPITGLVYNRRIDRFVPEKEGWVNGQSGDGKMPLKYGYFAPQMGQGKRPLIIWLHGGGEGGHNPELAYYGNKVVNLASPKFQAYFGGTYVLAPQTPTFWLDDGGGEMSLSGQTIYGEALMSLIEEFVCLHSDIDRDRIYIGGCSNGGFMTMRMILDYPDYFAGAYPVCEVLLNEKITDQDLDLLKQTPIWFTHAKNDTIVEPDLYVLPTYKRLLEAGHEDVHLSYFDTVTDSRGFRYDMFGHASWIHMLNDDCKLDYDGKPVMEEGQEVTLLQWLAKKHK